MEPWDYIRFVYETESLVAIGGIAAITGSPYNPTPPDWSDPAFPTQPGSPQTGPVPATPTNTTGKDQEKVLDGGGFIVPPCWLINEFPGMQGWMENGVRKYYTGEYQLLRGPVAKVRTRYGYGVHGDGSYPDNFQGYIMEALDDQGRAFCAVYEWGGPHCRVPGSPFPLDAQPCVGETIGSDPSNANAHTSDLWQRFEDSCLKPNYPDCGPWT